MQIRDWKFLHLDAFRLEKRAGAHSRLTFAVTALEKHQSWYFAQAGKTICVRDDGGKPMFVGRVDAVARSESYLRGCRIEVEASDFTCAADEDVHLRVFQNPAQTLADVVGKEALPTVTKARCAFDCAAEAGRRKIPHLLVQQETDFAFACRLAAAAGLDAWVVDTDELGGGRLELGTARKLSQHALASENCVRLRIAQGRVPRASATVGTYACELGQRVTLDGKPYVVDHVVVTREHEVDRMTYGLRKEKPAGTGDLTVPAGCAVRLQGIVRDTNDPEHRARVRVDFTDETSGIEDKTPEAKRCWLPYRPPYAGRAGGIVFLPEPGDAVESIVTGSDAFVATEYRSQPLPQECQDVRVKYIGNNTQQRIFWKAHSLELRSGETSIVLDDKKIELRAGKNRLTLGEQGIELVRGESRAVLNDEGTYLRHGTQQAALAGDVRLESGAAFTVRAGGKLVLKASGVASIDGSRVELA